MSSFKFNQNLGGRMLDCLERTDHYAELDPLADVLDSHIEHAPRRAEGLRSDQQRHDGVDFPRCIPRQTTQVPGLDILQVYIAEAAGKIGRAACRERLGEAAAR